MRPDSTDSMGQFQPSCRFRAGPSVFHNKRTGRYLVCSLAMWTGLICGRVNSFGAWRYRRLDKSVISLLVPNFLTKY